MLRRAVGVVVALRVYAVEITDFGRGLEPNKFGILLDYYPGYPTQICSKMQTIPYSTKIRIDVNFYKGTFGMLLDRVVHSKASLAKTYNSEAIVPDNFHPRRGPTRSMFEKKDWLFLKNIAQSGSASDVSIIDVKVQKGALNFRLNCVHRTQPGRNFSVFYRRIDEYQIMILGTGNHTKNNKTYRVNWADGSESRIDISKTANSGNEFLPNPIGGLFGFRSKDAVINRDFLCDSILP